MRSALNARYHQVDRELTLVRRELSAMEKHVEAEMRRANAAQAELAKRLDRVRQTKSGSVQHLESQVKRCKADLRSCGSQRKEIGRLRQETRHLGMTIKHIEDAKDVMGVVDHRTGQDTGQDIRR